MKVYICCISYHMYRQYIQLYAGWTWSKKNHVILVFLSHTFPPLASGWFCNWCLSMSFNHLAICLWLTSGLDDQISTLQPLLHRKAVKVCTFVVGKYVPWSSFDRAWLSAQRWTRTGTPADGHQSNSVSALGSAVCQRSLTVPALDLLRCCTLSLAQMP